MSHPDSQPIELCVERMGTPFEMVGAFFMGPPAEDASEDMWLDWSATQGTLVNPNRPMQLKIRVLGAYAEKYGIEVERLPSEEFYGRHPDLDPRKQR